MGLASRSKGLEKYRLLGSARVVHCIAAVAAAANLLLVLFLLNGRIAADTILVVHGKLAPFEWVGTSPVPCDYFPTFTPCTFAHANLVIPMCPLPVSKAVLLCNITASHVNCISPEGSMLVTLC